MARAGLCLIIRISIGWPNRQKMARGCLKARPLFVGEKSTLLCVSGDQTWA